MWKKPRVLEHVTDAAPFGRQSRARARVFEHDPVDFDVRFVGSEQARNDVDECRLAAAGAAEQAHDAGSRDVDRHVQRESVAALQGANAEHAGLQRPSSRCTRRAMSSEISRPIKPSENEMVASRAASASPSGVCNAVYSASGSVRVCPGIFDTNVMTAPNSPRPAANAVTTPARIPGSISGNVIVKNRSQGPAPSVRAASSSPGSTPSSEMRIARTISGKVITAVASAAPAVVKINWMPNCSYNQCPTGPRMPNVSSNR